MVFDSHIRSYEAGRVIFSEGEPGEAAYIIDQGQVELSALINGEQVVIAHLRKGEMFGEMSLIDDQLRSATAIAKTPARLIVVPRKYIREKIDLSDNLVSMSLRVVLERYREMRIRLEHVLAGKELDHARRYYQQETSAEVHAEETRLAAERLQAEDNLRKALEENQLELFYQPIINLSENRVAGCESLIRWRHPKRGLVSPAEFIGLAEETGLIVPIGLWILEEACQAQKRFATINSDLYVSINLSGRQFETDVTDELEKILTKTGVDRKRIKLEITESLLMANPLQVAEILYTFKGFGVDIAIDDFGTGYSSFSYLHRFPLDVLKIDQSFVFTMRDNPKSLEIVRTLCTLAKALGMSVIAEGIEDPADVEILRDFSADFGQGFYFAKPMPEAEFIAFLENYGAS
jgi:EAL domain-containing protein (putative c-di-GMP-specific phosphodiesterase class I)